VAAAHRDSDKARLLRDLWSRYPYRADEDLGVPRVLRTAEPALIPEVPEEGMRAFARDAEHLALLRALGPRSYLAVPLVARGKTYGVLSLVYSDSGRRYGPEELELAAELARRAAGAIDNARLFQQAASAAVRLRAQIEETERTHAALAEREAQFRTLADSIPQLAWMADASGSIFWYNRGWYAFTGTTPEEMEGWGWQSVHHPEHLPTVLERWRASIATGEPFEMEFPLRGADGRFRWFLTRVLPVKDAGGAVARWFGTNTDIDELRAAREAAQEANRAKAQFLANMSHELRTPLNAIGGYADLLELGVHGPVTDAQRADLGRIKRSAEHLLSLINDILNFAKVEAGQVAIDLREVRMRGFLAELEPLVAPLMHAKGLTYRYRPCDEGLAAWADPEKVRQILLNLLSNAIKFTEAGGRVALACARRGETIVVQVRDTGIGVPRDKLETVFAPFVQVHRGLTVNHEGTGLGLAISRDLARMMGGELTAESEEGRGSTFSLTLPARAAGAEPAAGGLSG
jgi:PAS domain S-box-containing protein